MQSISYAFPLTRGITAGRALVSGASLTDVAPLLWGGPGIGLVYGLPGYILFLMFEIVANRRGTLEVL